MCMSAGEKEISTNKVCWVVQWITYKTRQFPKLSTGSLQHNLKPPFYLKPWLARRVCNAYLLQYKMTIKCQQGHQNTPCGVYSHRMSTVQCNSTDPAARNGGLMMPFSDACHDNGEVEVVQCRSIMSLQRESWSASHTRSCAPEKLFLKEVSARAWTGVAGNLSQLHVSLGTVFLKMQSGSGRPILLHTHALKEHSKTMIKSKNCSWNSYLFTTKSEVV